MPLDLKARLPVSLLLLGTLLLAIAGCGDGGEGGGESSLASIAPPAAPVFVEATLRPEGQLRSDVDAVAQKIAGIDDLGAKIVSELESEAEEEGEPFDYETEVEPWLGERAGIFLDDFNGDDFEKVGVAIETTDPDAAQAFLEKQSEADEDPIEDASYEDVEYKIDSADESVYGLVDDLLVITEQEAAFKEAVDAANGDSLDDEAAYGDAMDNAAEGSLADAYVDVGLLIQQSGDEIDESALKAFESAGIEPKEATAVASVIPAPDRIEVEISSDLGDQEAPSGDPSELLASLPADSFAALAVSGFGEQLREALDELDREGVPGEIPPNQLKKGLDQLGIDLESLAGSFGEAGVFAEGSSENSLGGALVLTTDDPKEAAETVATIGDLLRSTGTTGVTAVSGRASGFSVRDEELGRKPLVVVSKDDRIAIGYGLPATLRGVAASNTKALGDTAAFEEAEAALGDTPISFFVDGPGALRLAESLSGSDPEFREAKKYLRNVTSLALGSEADGNRVTAKLIAGIE
jgi:hypothetical protein